jgi:hypothetical protein
MNIGNLDILIARLKELPFDDFDMKESRSCIGGQIKILTGEANIGRYIGVNDVTKSFLDVDYGTAEQMTYGQNGTDGCTHPEFWNASPLGAAAMLENYLEEEVVDWSILDKDKRYVIHK